MTSSDVAGRFGVAPFTVRRWVKSGVIKAVLVTVGGHLRFDPADVDAFAATRVPPATSDH